MNGVAREAGGTEYDLGRFSAEHLEKTIPRRDSPVAWSWLSAEVLMVGTSPAET